MSGLQPPWPTETPTARRHPEQPQDSLRAALVLLGALRRSLILKPDIAAGCGAYLTWKERRDSSPANLVHAILRATVVRTLDDESNQLLEALTGRIGQALDQLEGRAP